MDAFDSLAGGAGLIGDQHMAQHFAGAFTDLIKGFDDPHTALAVRVVLKLSGAAATGVNLRFDDIYRATQFFRLGGGFVDRKGDTAIGYRDAVIAEQLLGLIFMNIHRNPILVRWSIRWGFSAVFRLIFS